MTEYDRLNAVIIQVESFTCQLKSFTGMKIILGNKGSGGGIAPTDLFDRPSKPLCGGQNPILLVSYLYKPMYQLGLGAF